MSEKFRSAAEEFVTEFLDYVQTHDILDYYNRQTQQMEQSPGVSRLIYQAKQVFPARADDGKAETDKLSEQQINEAIDKSPNVIDTREMFSRRVQKNGGTRGILRRLYEGNPEARKEMEDFFAAEDGEKEFYVPPKV